MSFSFKTASEIIFGPGEVKKLPDIVAKFGNRVLLVIDAYIDPESDFLTSIKGERFLFRPTGEPTISSVMEATEIAKDNQIQVIVGVGGGSSIDTAKAAGVLVANGGHPLDYLEVVGQGKPLTPESLPVIAIPTTAGTGAEVTANTPLFSPEHKVKASLRSPAMLPDVALVDPELTLTCPAQVTASSGLDALTQCLEPFTSCKANNFTNILAAEGLRHAGRGLRAAYQDGANIQARTDMAMCSLLGGMSLANAKLGSVHGLAAPLGGLLGAPHGLVCAAVLEAATRVNISALETRDPQSDRLKAYEKAMKLLTGNEKATLEDGINWLKETVQLLNVPGLRSMGLENDQVDHIAEEGLRASSMKGNPIVLTHGEVRRILEESM